MDSGDLVFIDHEPSMTLISSPPFHSEEGARERHAQRVENRVERPEQRIVLGLDFGTTYTGAAYAQSSPDWFSGKPGSGKSTLLKFWNSSAEALRLPNSKPDPRRIADQSNSRVFEIPGYLGNSIRRTANALGDYCAKHNFMKEDYAVKLGLEVDRSLTSDVKVGSGKRVATTGTVESLFRFKDESAIYLLTFHLLPSCVHDVILGKPFLKATSTFSNAVNRLRRVKERVIKGITQRHLLYLGESAPRFQGLLNGMPQDALADSGSRVMVMDEDYACSLGLSVSKSRDERTRLIFGDKSTAYTSGMTYGVEWEFGAGGEERYSLDFHILKNAPASVIFSDSFLFQTEAYSLYECFLVDDDDEDDDAFFFAIDVDERLVQQGNPLNFLTSDSDYLELVRRGQAEDSIADLPRSEQGAAWAVEHARRAHWEVSQRVAPSTSPGSVAVLQPGTESSSSTTQLWQQTSPVAQPKRKRWRFKLKRKDNT